MAKWANDLFMDEALNRLKDTVNAMAACSGQPATRASAIGGQKLAIHTMSTGDFTLANGDTSGRKVTVAQQTGVPVSTTGGANHVALVSASTLEYVTTATSQSLTAGNTLTFNAWDIEIADPS